MTNHEAISILDQVKKIIVKNDSWSNQAEKAVIDAVELATIALKAQEDTDTISRRQKGEWINNHTTCSKCGWQMIDDVIQSPNMVWFNFFPNCGADMRP